MDSVTTKSSQIHPNAVPGTSTWGGALLVRRSFLWQGAISAEAPSARPLASHLAFLLPKAGARVQASTEEPLILSFFGTLQQSTEFSERAILSRRAGGDHLRVLRVVS